MTRIKLKDYSGIRLRLCLLSLLICLGASAGSAWGFPGLDGSTPGLDQARSTWRTGLSSEAGAGLFTGVIKTTPPDGQHFDRRLTSFLRVGWDQAVNTLLVRVRAQAISSLRTEEDDLEPKIYIDERKGTGAGSVDLAVRLQNGLDLFGGILATATPGYLRITSTANGKSKRRYEASTLINPRVGLVKRGGGDWAAGAYAQVGAENSVAYREDVFDGSSRSDSESSYSPTRIAAFGSSSVGNGMKIDGEFAVVQAGNGGPKDPANRPVNDDYFALQGGLELTLYGSTRGRASVYHQTLSYSDQSFMSLDNIPGSAVRLEGIVLESNLRLSAGLVYGFGKDEQSLPEFNASYSYRGVGAIAQVVVAL